MAEQNKLLQEAERLLAQGRKLLETSFQSANPNAAPEVKEEPFHAFRVSCSSWLDRVFGDNHTYSKTFRNEVTLATVSRTKRALGILEAAKDEINGEWLTTTRGKLAKDMLSNILRHAQTQRDAKNLRASVLICGAVIDEFLRRICLKEGIALVNEQMQNKPAMKKALQLTGEAYKKKVYDRTINKQFITWIELFNEQSGENSTPPEEKRVDKMLKEIRKLLTTIPL